MKTYDDILFESMVEDIFEDNNDLDLFEDNNDFDLFEDTYDDGWGISLFEDEAERKVETEKGSSTPEEKKELTLVGKLKHFITSTIWGNIRKWSTKLGGFLKKLPGNIYKGMKYPYTYVAKYIDEKMFKGSEEKSWHKWFKKTLKAIWLVLVLLVESSIVYGVWEVSKKAYQKYKDNEEGEGEGEATMEEALSISFGKSGLMARYKNLLVDTGKKLKEKMLDFARKVKETFSHAKSYVILGLGMALGAYAKSIYDKRNDPAAAASKAKQILAKKLKPVASI